MVFRGTDHSLVGWKENFNMSYEDVVPSQRDAMYYLDKMAQEYKGNIRLGGHSKGGNLAIYAAAHCRVKVRERIFAIYNNDGPGINEHEVKNPDYIELEPK
ncbi:MAG: DUF2974 domain-containing protein, partial [Firmicutes bacterium]|nr:DUF2974 domain-containing protein [Bacillota bacterium]